MLARLLRKHRTTVLSIAALVLAAFLTAVYLLLSDHKVCNQETLENCGHVKRFLLYTLDSWDEISAVGQLLGAVASMLALVGLLGIYKQIKSEQLALNTQTSWTMYDASLSVLQMFVNEPGLRPYFYDNRPLPMYEPARSRVLAAAEVVGDHLENIVMSGKTEAIARDTFYVWVRYIYMMGRRSQVMRRFLGDRPNPRIDVARLGLGEGRRYDRSFTDILLYGKVPAECEEEMATDRQPLRGLTLSPLRIEALGEELRAATDIHRRIVDWERDEWGDEWAAYVEEQIAATTRPDATHPAVPEIFVALDDGGRPMGCIMLLHDDMTTRPDLTPWIGGLYVAKELRGRGIASALMIRALDEAALADIETVWLYTEDQRKLYESFGWQFVEQDSYEGDTVDIMRYDFYERNSPAGTNGEERNGPPRSGSSFSLRPRFRRMRL